MENKLNPDQFEFVKQELLANSQNFIVFFRHISKYQPQLLKMIDSMFNRMSQICTY